MVSVLDGDTIEVLNGHHTERIRLSGIDCPEKGQAYGQNAKQATSALVFGKDVTLQTHGKDKYRRTIGEVLLPDGTNVNHTLVKEGWCWWYRKYAPGDATLERLETEAREAQRGLWADPQPVPPWEWRRHLESDHPQFFRPAPLLTPPHGQPGLAPICTLRAATPDSLPI